ncbi:hypothetical protein F5Y04DRAFT_243411 [Hypomontagnella monticulosa]|nr:hypothetical protein F5Y04DRAFT_243411 [Hypomontagnella monticulosa]
MSSKRKFSDFKADTSSREEAQGHEHTQGYHAPKRVKDVKKSKAKPGSVNWMKKRARTIERRFKSGQNMPANVENELERELAHHQQRIAEAADEKKRKTMISKYHMVRFFERKKADRLAKRISSQLEKATDETEIEKLKADLHRAEIDSIYARYFPYRERYISLYPVASLGKSARTEENEGNESTAAQALRNERPPMWEVIEKAAEKGTSALVEIRERKLGGNSKTKLPDTTSKDSSSTIPTHSKTNNSGSMGKTKAKGKRNEASTAAKSNDDSDSEGGFFE